MLYVRHDTAPAPTTPTPTHPEGRHDPPTVAPPSGPALTDDVLDLSRVVVPLLRGVLYQADNAATWALLRRHHARVRDHMAVMGLELLVDEAEGYAHLRQMDYDDVDIPRLVPRHRLSFNVSLLLALLRKRLAEFDASSSDPRLILTRDQIAELLRVHLPESTNEVRLASEVDALLTKVVSLGFLRQVTGQDAHLRGAPHPQGLRRRAVARRVRPPPARVPRHASSRPTPTPTTASRHRSTQLTQERADG